MLLIFVVFLNGVGPTGLDPTVASKKSDRLFLSLAQFCRSLAPFAALCQLHIKDDTHSLPQLNEDIESIEWLELLDLG
ncbi:hypothetical protein BC827DRAFT_1192617 [Russula dissimulans]|jgi:hypothetical protein|nr:hypothetical protein BC827DRAFT_1192617 [Russula dissimulans]